MCMNASKNILYMWQMYVITLLTLKTDATGVWKAQACYVWNMHRKWDIRCICVNWFSKNILFLKIKSSDEVWFVVSFLVCLWQSLHVRWFGGILGIRCHCCGRKQAWTHQTLSRRRSLCPPVHIAVSASSVEMSGLFCWLIEVHRFKLWLTSDMLHVIKLIGNIYLSVLLLFNVFCVKSHELNPTQLGLSGKNDKNNESPNSSMHSGTIASRLLKTKTRGHSEYFAWDVRGLLSPNSPFRSLNGALALLRKTQVQAMGTCPQGLKVWLYGTTNLINLYSIWRPFKWLHPAKC